jgi:hypothetical protein
MTTTTTSPVFGLPNDDEALTREEEWNNHDDRGEDDFWLFANDEKDVDVLDELAVDGTLFAAAAIAGSANDDGDNNVVKNGETEIRPCDPHHRRGVMTTSRNKATAIMEDSLFSFPWHAAAEEEDDPNNGYYYCYDGRQHGGCCGSSSSKLQI